MDDSFDNSEIEAVVEELRVKSEKLGLYLQDAVIATPQEDMALKTAEKDQAIAEAIKDGATFLVLGTFTIGDQAFSKRVQDPEQYEIDKEAQMIMPDPIEEMREKLRKNLEEGKGLFDDE